MFDNFDEKLEENITLKSEDDETLSQKDIFDNCSSTVGGKSPGNSIISNLSTEMEKFSINTTTSPQNDKSSVHNSPVNVDSTIKNESQITLLENTSTIMNIEPQTSSMKELSSSNHPTHSSTNIETQIPPVNLSQSKKDSSKSDHSTHSPTKNVDKNHTEGLMQSKTNMEANESLNSTKLPPNHTPNPQQPKIDAPNKSKKKRINTSY